MRLCMIPLLTTSRFDGDEITAMKVRNINSAGAFIQTAVVGNNQNTAFLKAELSFKPIDDRYETEIPWVDDQ